MLWFVDGSLSLYLSDIQGRGGGCLKCLSVGDRILSVSFMSLSSFAVNKIRLLIKKAGSNITHSPWDQKIKAKPDSLSAHGKQIKKERQKQPNTPEG